MRLRECIRKKAASLRRDAACDWACESFRSLAVQVRLVRARHAQPLSVTPGVWITPEDAARVSHDVNLVRRASRSSRGWERLHSFRDSLGRRSILKRAALSVKLG